MIGVVVLTPGVGARKREVTRDMDRRAAAVTDKFGAGSVIVQCGRSTATCVELSDHRIPGWH